MACSKVGEVVRLGASQRSALVWVADLYYGNLLLLLLPLPLLLPPLLPPPTYLTTTGSLPRQRVASVRDRRAQPYPYQQPHNHLVGIWLAAAWVPCTGGVWRRVVCVHPRDGLGRPRLWPRVSRSIDLSIYRSIYLSIYRSIHPSIYLSILPQSRRRPRSLWLRSLWAIT